MIMFRRVAVIVFAVAVSVLGVRAAAAQSWAWCSSDPEGTWQVPGGPSGTDYFVQNDAWNGGASAQTICANSPSDVQVTSQQPSGNTEIETYPDVGGLYTGHDLPVAGFKSVQSRYTESLSGDTIGEAANDVWLNGWSIEIMIWVDTGHEDPTYLPSVGTAVLGGRTFTVLHNGSEFIFWPGQTHLTSGTTHILAAIHWMIGHGWAPANSGITEAEFGWEIAGTVSVPPETAALTAYQLVATCKPGKACMS
jgi:hypothetical protein